VAATYSSSLHSYSTVNAPYNVGFATYTATALGSGSSNQSVVDVYNGIRSATGGGGATTNDNAVGLRTSVNTASGSGQGDVSGVVSAVAHLRLATATGSGGSSVTQLRTTFATGSSAGLGTASGTGLRTTFQTALGAATGGSQVIDVYTPIRSASGSGSATTGDLAVGLRTVLRTATDTALGTSTVLDLTTFFRLGAGSGLGSSETQYVRTTFATATSSGINDYSLTLWRNAGQSLDLEAVMPPKRLFTARPYAIRR
jgi:hypothetical protein